MNILPSAVSCEGQSASENCYGGRVRTRGVQAVCRIGEVRVKGKGKLTFMNLWYYRFMAFKFSEHLNEFKECYQVPPIQEAVGHELSDYIDRAFGKNARFNLPQNFSCERKLDRRELAALCKTDADPVFCFCAIMAWGMRKDLSGWKHFDSAISDVISLRNKILKIKGAKSRGDAFSLLNGSERIPGLGIAFFTKIIFFFRGDGYILDQWTAKSAKLIAPDLPMKVYKLGPATSVTSEQYDHFCGFVESLANEMGNSWQAGDAETGMFGGRKDQNRWRRYVIHNF